MQISRNRLGAAAGVVTLGGVALGLIGTGVGANFIQSAAGNAHISVGNLDCQLTSDSPYVTVGDGGHSAEVNLPEIESSAPSISTALVSVRDTGSTSTYVNWVTSTSGSIFGNHSVTPVVPNQDAVLTPGHTADYNLGFQWGTLTNSDEKHTGTVTYTANCTDNDVRSEVSFPSQDGGLAGWNSDGTISLTMPAGAAQDAGAIVQIAGQAATLPDSAPTFATDNYAAGSPRWYIQLHNGNYLFGYPTNSGLGSSNWSENAGSGPSVPQNSNTYVDWATVLKDFPGAQVDSIQIVMDQDQPNTTDTITSISYGGNQILGSLG